jgi:hypothetical protein
VCEREKSEKEEIWAERKMEKAAAAAAAAAAAEVRVIC